MAPNSNPGAQNGTPVHKKGFSKNFPEKGAQK
jgi:hypothetical protein